MAYVPGVRVLFLGPPSPTLDFLQATVTVEAEQEPISAEHAADFDLLVSHGYRHILRPDVLAAAPAVNLHISYLPWNRGADLNLWSWIDDTPKGVTVHWIDEGMDTGPVIARRQVELNERGTLASTYAQLQAEMTVLFREQWPLIRSGLASRIPQTGLGSSHRVADKARVEHLLAAGWDTRVASLVPVAYGV